MQFPERMSYAARALLAASLFLTSALVPWSAAAAVGTLQTIDGGSYTGEVRLVTGGFSIATTNATNTVRIEQLKHLIVGGPGAASAPEADGAAIKPAASVPVKAGIYTGRRMILPTSEVEAQTWRYTTNRPSKGWDNLDYNDTTWEIGQAGFGEPGTPHSVVRTKWKTPVIWLRRTFTLDAMPVAPRLRIFHDEDVVVYVNGRHALTQNNNSASYVEFSLGNSGLRVGENIIAARCTNRVGGQNIDLGLYDSAQLPSASPALMKAPPAHGLLGLYFNDREFNGKVVPRYDALLDFDWGDAGPGEGVRDNDFSVCWVGQIEPRFSESHTFHLQCNDGARLWIGGVRVFNSWKDGPQRLDSKPVRLVKGSRYDVRLEFFNGPGKSALQLSWSSPSTPRAVVPSSQLYPGSLPELTANGLKREKVEKEQAVEKKERARTKFGARMPESGELPAGVLLTSGSFIAREVIAADETSIRFADAAKSEAPLSALRVARIVMNPIPLEELERIPSGHIGLLLANKDFFEADFRGFQNQAIKMNSVLFGVRAYELRQAEVLCLRPVPDSRAMFTLRTADASRLLTSSFTVGPGGIMVNDPLLPGLRLRPEDVMEISRRH